MLRDCLLYLKVGDQVIHENYKKWGLGTVIEERTSQVPGGFCYVRIDFKDGATRIFDNNFKSQSCCYYTGIRKL